jgi:hypothetical protein
VDWIDVAMDTDKCWAHLNTFKFYKMKENDRQMASKQVFWLTELSVGHLFCWVVD